MKKKYFPDLLLSLLLLLTAAALCFLILRRYFTGISPANLSSEGIYLSPIYERGSVLAELSALLPLFLLDLAALLAAALFHASKKSPGLWQAGKPFLPPKPPEDKAMGCPDRSTLPKRILRLFLFAAALLLIVLGVQNGGIRDVLIKAINICTECIGLG